MNVAKKFLQGVFSTLLGLTFTFLIIKYVVPVDVKVDKLFTPAAYPYVLNDQDKMLIRCRAENKEQARHVKNLRETIKLYQERVNAAEITSHTAKNAALRGVESCVDSLKEQARHIEICEWNLSRSIVRTRNLEKKLDGQSAG